MKMMKIVISLAFLYAFLMALSQIFLKLGVNSMGPVSIKGAKDAVFLVVDIFRNKALLAGMAIMISAFFLWLYVLSISQLGIAFPITAVMYIFVAVMSYMFLGEKLAPQCYWGIGLITLGVFVLLYRWA